MARPQVITLNLAAGISTSVVNAATAGTTVLPLVTSTGVVLDNQRRLLITAAGNESTNTFTITGLNQAGFAVAESLLGPNTTTTLTNMDFKTVLSVKALSNTINTVSVGTVLPASGSTGIVSGSSMWNLASWHASPSNIELSNIVTTAASGVTYSIQYSYDDPNNLPSGVRFAQPFNHPTLANLTTSLDGSINDPITAWRLAIVAGTGTVRATGIHGGIGSP
jgi:hypothetical protein